MKTVFKNIQPLFRLLRQYLGVWKKRYKILRCVVVHISLSHDTQPHNNRNISLYCVSLITPRTSCVMTCLYVATINTTQWSVIGHTEGWHFLIPAVQLRFNDFHCLELRGGSGEVMQRGVCHLNSSWHMLLTTFNVGSCERFFSSFLPGTCLRTQLQVSVIYHSHHSWII